MHPLLATLIICFQTDITKYYFLFIWYLMKTVARNDLVAPAQGHTCKFVGRDDFFMRDEEEMTFS